jgi:hypothetical protein
LDGFNVICKIKVYHLSILFNILVKLVEFKVLCGHYVVNVVVLNAVYVVNVVT